MKTPLITLDAFPETVRRARRSYQEAYLAMYSSVWGGVVTDPGLMVVPADDHMVHRGDGVFETCKCVSGALYNLHAHLERLVHSAVAIGIVWPGGTDSLQAAVIAAVHAGGQPDATVRILLSRGPGGFGVNPYESPEPALYVIAMRSRTAFMEAHPEGARVRRSRIPAKPPFFAGVKNCNYLPNVLMKKEAVDGGVDFVVGFDGDGFLTEGATENVGIVTADGELVFPRLEKVLRGTTMMRVVDLARAAQADEGEPRGVAFRDIDEADVRAASEMLLVGTTINVTAVCRFDEIPIGSGRPGPIWERLNRALDDDIRHNETLRMKVF